MKKCLILIFLGFFNLSLSVGFEDALEQLSLQQANVDVLTQLIQRKQKELPGLQNQTEMSVKSLQDEIATCQIIIDIIREDIDNAQNIRQKERKSTVINRYLEGIAKKEREIQDLVAQIRAVESEVLGKREEVIFLERELQQGLLLLKGLEDQVLELKEKARAKPAAVNENEPVFFWHTRDSWELVELKNELRDPNKKSEQKRRITNKIEERKNDSSYPKDDKPESLYQCFSNWWMGKPLIIEGVSFPSAEHAFMYEKVKFFAKKMKFDEGFSQYILDAPNPNVAKKMAREITDGASSQILNDWDDAKFEIMKKIVSLKFSTDPELKKILLSTGNAYLAEASPYDGSWGIKLNASDAKKIWSAGKGRPVKWPGMNLLGIILMEVRTELQRETALPAIKRRTSSPTTPTDKGKGRVGSPRTLASAPLPSVAGGPSSSAAPTPKLQLVDPRIKRKIDLIKKAHLSHGKGYGDLTQFRQWAKDKKWNNFHGSGFHYDWWMFPTDDQGVSCPEKKGGVCVYKIDSKDAEALQQDQEFMKNYLEGVSLQMLAWGWNFHEGKLASNGGHYDRYGVRLYKLTKSLKMLGLWEEYQASIQAFKRHNGI